MNYLTKPRREKTTDGKFVMIHMSEQILSSQQEEERNNAVDNATCNPEEEKVQELDINDINFENLSAEKDLFNYKQEKRNWCIRNVWLENTREEGGMEDIREGTNTGELIKSEEKKDNDGNAKTRNVISQLEEGREALVSKCEDLERRLYKGKKTKEKLSRDKQLINQMRSKIEKIDSRIANEREKETTKLFQQRMSLRPKTARKGSANIYRKDSKPESAKVQEFLGDSQEKEGQTMVQKDSGLPSSSQSRNSSRATQRTRSAVSVAEGDDEDEYSLPMAWITNRETRNEPCIGTETVRQRLERDGQTSLPVEIYSELLSEKEKKQVAKTTHYLPPIAVQKNFWDKEVFEDPPMIREDEKMRITYFPNRRRLLYGRARVYLKQEQFLKFHNLKNVVNNNRPDAAVLEAAKELLEGEKTRKPKPLPAHFM